VSETVVVKNAMYRNYLVFHSCTFIIFSSGVQVLAKNLICQFWCFSGLSKTLIKILPWKTTENLQYIMYN